MITTISIKRYWNFLLKLIIFLCHIKIGSADSCWINDETCLVHGILYKNVSEILPLDIDCATTTTTTTTTPNKNNNATSNVTQPPDYLLKRFERAYGLTLNGCHKGLKWKTFGFEFLPNCDKITELSVEKFHADTLFTLQCPQATFMQLEILYYKHNEISGITAAALANLSLLREIHFVSNALQYIEGEAFDNLHFIERIHIENEPLLVLKNSSQFQRTKVADLRLIGLKFVASSIFENLPETLQNLTITKTKIIGNNIEDVEATKIEEFHDVGILNINNPRLLRNVTIIACELRSFKLNDLHESVKFLNLSENNLKEFEVLLKNKNSSSELRLLDLSHNKLNHLPWQLTHPYTFHRLEKLYLQGNFLKQLPLQTLLSSLRGIKFIDLTKNKLETLEQTNEKFENVAFDELQLRIDHNPWNCKWLLDFAHEHPDKFRIFQYEKFLSQINVNGLECEPEDISAPTFIPKQTLTVENSPNQKLQNLSFNANQTYMNISTFTLIYGSPWDIKRNQRAEALIIVFMLPVGIAILFLLLYLWIYCQRVFHISFYQTCPFFKRSITQPRINHFDIVREMPQNISTAAANINNNEGYELPLNGTVPICNCSHKNIANSSNNITNEKCQRMHHITYVPLPPNEHAQQIYEEIIETDGIDAVNQTMHNVHPMYDHLTFK